MGVITDLFLSIPIGVIYNMIIHETATLFNDKFSYKDKVQRSLLMVFGGGLIGFIIAMFILSGDIQNTALKYGLILGSILLISHSIFYNWHLMQNDTRIIVMILALFALIWYSYSNNSSNNTSNQNYSIHKNESFEPSDTYDSLVSNSINIKETRDRKKKKSNNL